MPIMNLLRWIAFFPIAVFAGLVSGGLILLVGNYLVGHWRVPSGIVICFGAMVTPFSWMIAGLNTAPTKSPAVKWVLLTPLLLICVPLGIALIFLLWGRLPLEELSGEGSLSYSLSPYWQLLIYNFYFIGATLYMVPKSPSEIAE